MLWRGQKSFFCQQLKQKFLFMQPTVQSLISLSYSISLSCKLRYPTHSTVSAAKQAVAISGLPHLMVPQGVQSTNNFLNTNATKQTSSYTSEYFLSRSKIPPFYGAWQVNQCSLQFADTDLLICTVYSDKYNNQPYSLCTVQLLFRLLWGRMPTSRCLAHTRYIVSSVWDWRTMLLPKFLFKNSDNALIPSNCGSRERQTYMEYVHQQNNQSCEMVLPIK
jgi:hypothetical protein